LRIILAKTAGFCMGVKRAMDQVLSIARDKSGPIFTYGPLIHNRQVVDMLEARGICARTRFEGITKGTVLLRAHGAPPDVAERLREAGLAVEDGTCPHVLKGQRSIARRSAEGYSTVIVGDRDHDEVVGLAGHARGRCHIIASVDEARAAPLDEKVLVVAQTTFNEELFRQITEELRRRKPDIEIVDSICNATSQRQEEARELARTVDAMVVVGGFHSANTRRLAEIAESTGTPTFHVETADQLDVDRLAAYATVGVTAGASTPSWVTSTVLERLRHIGETRSGPAHLRGALARVIIDGNLYVAAGAAALTYAVIKLLGLRFGSAWQRVSLMAAAFGYIFFAYFLGRWAEGRVGGSGLTRRGAFYRAHPAWMGVSCLLLAGISIAALARFRWVVVGLLGVSYAIAAAYGILISPRRHGVLTLLRNIPASKDLFAAAGWTVVTVLVPTVAATEPVEYEPVSGYAVAAVAGFVFGLAFIRSVMFDFSDVMADRLLGRDTLPAVIGVTPAKTVLAVLAVVLAVILAVSAAFGGIGAVGYWMLLCPAYVLCYLLVSEEVIAASEHRCAAVVDGGMLLAGAIALLYTLWS